MSKLRIYKSHLPIEFDHEGKQFITSSATWVRYYKENAKNLLAIPWERGCDLPTYELDEIVASLQAWQLGETSEGAHLKAAAAKYSEDNDDPLFNEAAALFTKEEQLHGELLGCFLDLTGAQRIKKNWGDSLFRMARYAVKSMETWCTPVIMVECLALIYYRALSDATSSQVLKTICRQILHDEIPHIRFQYERLAVILKPRTLTHRRLTIFLQKLAFILVCLLVWTGHKRVFHAAGINFREYWKRAWKRMAIAWKNMNPELYSWREPSRAKRIDIRKEQIA